MRQVLDHIYRAQMAHSCNNGDKLRIELESAAKLVEEKFTYTNTQRDAILLLEECHKKLRACKLVKGCLAECSCLHCRVERFIAQNSTRL